MISFNSKTYEKVNWQDIDNIVVIILRREHNLIILIILRKQEHQLFNDLFYKNYLHSGIETNETATGTFSNINQKYWVCSHCLLLISIRY